MMVKLDGWVSPKSSYRMFADALLCGNNILAYSVMDPLSRLEAR